MIRNMTHYDIDKVCQVLRNFRDTGSVEEVKQFDDEQHVRKLLTQIIIGGGVAVLYEDTDLNILGIALGVISPNMWNPKTTFLMEICIYVEPEHRISLIPFRLIKEYTEQAKQMKIQNKINYFTVGRSFKHAPIKYEKFGYELAEEVWVQ